MLTALLQSEGVPVAAAVIGALLGSFGTLIVQLIIERRRKRNTRKTLRIGLRYELMRFLSNVQELNEIEGKENVSYDLYQATQLSTTFYNSNAGQIPLLSADEVALVIATYDTVTSTNQMLRAVSEQGMGEETSVNIDNISGYTNRMRIVVEKCLDEIEGNLDESHKSIGEWEKLLDPRRED